MGAVYQAKDLKRQGTMCAIKEMSLSMVPPAEQGQAIQNFKIEAKMLWGLDHPSLPRVMGFFSENQRYYLVMEYIDGQTLEELLERNKGPFPERRVLGWARQLCEVLEFLHQQKPPIIFRDMKPGNVMLARNGQIKLIDFGIARFFRFSGNPDTQLLGTPGFAPPEQYGRAQTDERSDIYALGMTLFQLLTNTLSETGFGLKDVRSNYPQISSTVARALEKATALDAEQRYESVAAFRRAILGEGNFVFESGEIASTTEELVELCSKYPEEASDYLAAGEIELWLDEIGEHTLSQKARRIHESISDPHESIMQFMRLIVSNNPRVRLPIARSSNGQLAAVESRVAAPPYSHPSQRLQLNRRPTSGILVSPRMLDFGIVYPGGSSPLLLTISGQQGQPVRGRIQTSDNWIRIDRTVFDGVSTSIDVRVNTMQFHRYIGRMNGSIVLLPEDGQSEIVIKVEADIQDYSANGGFRRGKTWVPDMDDEEEEEELVVTPSGQVFLGNQPLPHSRRVRAAEYKKYAPVSSLSRNGSQQAQWDPWPITPVQLFWQQRALTFVAAFMTSSLLYILSSSRQPLPLAPNPWALFVLAGMVPASTVGALLVAWKSDWPWQETINRAVTGMTSVLGGLALSRLLWFSLLPPLGVLQLCVMLVLAATLATTGVEEEISVKMLMAVRWCLLRLPLICKLGAVIVGALLGYALTWGAVSWGFTGFGMLVGIGVISALVWQVDSLLKQKPPR
ncbi:hypothetical protein KTT_03030 [Tengunoibacter tsumagoiensis]|uniref:non-specific serine/threonine protein kinase n=2 Tax=Tengunoibacter tsumagoiensis TaxID=2014871 RepID=A0A401ZUP3_9CHLR|nr:hypothetical protein KTT_03030 [Tengunoibacter tsumagoiensis]